MKNKRSDIYFLLFASFVEGAALMGTEILSSKIVAPYYGASLYVWAAVLGLTMGGLAIGYFWGGTLSQKTNLREKRLTALFCLASFFVFTMPFVAHWIMNAVLSLELRIGIFFSCVLFLLPPIICFGTITPIMISLFATSRDRIGLSAGIIYTISTAGGIISTFLTGFFLISNVGIKFSVNVFGLLLFGTALILLINGWARKKQS